jgi:enoyl-CoA hydratase/carnithine racemase
MAAVLFEKRDAVLRIALNRPAVLNAVDSGLLTELETGLTTHAADSSIRCLMLFGEGGCFGAGADLGEMVQLEEAGLRRFHDLRERTFALLESFPAPTMAVIERYALGTGLELALSCDFRIAAMDARFGVPSAKLGIVESYAYVSRLVRAVGPYRAKKLLLTGERVDAQTAFIMGLIEEIVPGETLFARADAVAGLLVTNSGYSMRESKKVVERCYYDPNLQSITDPALPMVQALQGPDFKEGASAFLAKRPARFQT